MEEPRPRWIQVALGLLALLWLAVTLLRFAFPPAEEPGPSPQQKVESALAGKLAQAALFDVSLSPALRDRLLELSRSLLAPEETPASRAVLEAAAGEKEQAVALLGDPVLKALRLQYETGQPASEEELDAALDGFFLEQARLHARPDRKVEERLRQEAGSVLLHLAVLGGVLGFNLLAGGATLLSFPFWNRRLRQERSDPGAPELPDAVLGLLVWTLGAQLVLAPALLTLLQGRADIARVLTVQLASYVFGLLVLVPVLRGGTWGFSRPGFRDLAAGFLGYWLCGPAVFLATLLSGLLTGEPAASDNPLLKMVQEVTPGELGLFVLLVALVGPAFEEFAFRGILYRSLRENLSRWAAILSSGTVFAVVHADAGGLLPLLALGVLFAYIYDLRGNLWSSFLSHGLWNGTTLLIMLVALS
ncbi:MAG: CPBP family intramembrane metalloprotease [Armatimonadetes bacterium]|nr:CPBP family intramembrane metalloprotease [Armatimonadota bacterium]